MKKCKKVGMEMYMVTDENDPCPKCGENLEKGQKTLQYNVVDGEVSRCVASIVKCAKCDFQQIMSNVYLNY
jgi:uncharacterized protein with PIN domain